MLSVAEQVIEDFNGIKTKQGYKYLADYQLLNSYDFSVAQSRDRLFYIAIRSDVVEEKDITPLKIFDNILQSSNRKYVLKDALEYIRPLEAERIKNRTEVYNNITGKKVDKNEYNPPKDSYINLINGGELKKIIFNHKARYCNDTNYEIYKRLEQGDDATDPKIADIMPYAHRNHVFKDKYFKLIEDKPSRTITAHLRMDCHSHIHPTQIRAITPREAARIQSFPDDYLFLGAYLKTYMQIGNAVPPLMAKGIAKEIKKYL
jgi:DNA (cytosine-5)-methyltransferase 1